MLDLEKSIDGISDRIQEAGRWEGGKCGKYEKLRDKEMDSIGPIPV